MVTAHLLTLDTGSVFAIACALIALVGLIAYLADDLIRTKAALHESDDEAWRDQVQYVITEVSQIMVAERLRELARNYENPENVRLRKKIARTEWKEGGTPIPALWLFAVADGINPPNGDPA